MMVDFYEKYLAEIPEYADENDYLQKSSEYQAEYESMLAESEYEGEYSFGYGPAVLIPESLYDLLVATMKDFEYPLDFIRLFGGRDLLSLFSDDLGESYRLLARLFTKVHPDRIYQDIHAPDLLPNYDDRRDITTILFDYREHSPVSSDWGGAYE